jgi:hypothetical protein
MPVSEECMILFCEDSAVQSSGNPLALSIQTHNVKKPLLEALHQNIGNPIKSESCSPNDILDRIRGLRSSSFDPVVVWLVQSSLADSERRIRECLAEIGDRRIFVAVTAADADNIMSNLVGSVHPYALPKPTGSLSSETQFWRVINALAVDIARSLDSENENDSRPSIFLAPVADPIDQLSRRLRHDLESRGFNVKPKSSSDPLKDIDTILSGSALSVHLFGQSGANLTDRGARQSMDVFRSTLAFARSHPEFRILGWTDAQSSDSTTTSMLSDQILRESKEFSLSAEVIQSTIEDFKSLLYDRLGQSLSASPSMILPSTAPTPVSQETPVAAGIGHDAPGAQLYVIYDPRDAEVAKPVTSWLQHEGIGVLLPEFPSEQNMLRAIHNENLRRCDGVLIVYGAVQEQWVRMKQQDLLRAAALGRKKNLSAKGVFLCSNKTEGKLRFSAPDMMVINGFETTANLAPFIQRLSQDPLKGLAG